jgi:1-phosphofructokinase family hexose kinase
MIVCVTPNPALDRTLIMAEYHAGGVSRAERLIVAAGGKGMNVARVIRALGGQVRCAAFIAGYTGQLFAHLAQQEGLLGDWVSIDGETRCCIIVADRSAGDVSVLNEPGPAVTRANWLAMRDRLRGTSAEADTICFSGSLPPGTPLDVFTEVLSELRQQGKTVWVDTSGEPLRAALTVPGIHVKVNHEEASAVLDTPVRNLEDAGAAARQFTARTGGTVVLTLGKAGAVMSVGEKVLGAVPPQVKAISSVASGDSFLAGLLVGMMQSPEQALRCAVAAGTANALSYGGGQFAMEDYNRILERVEMRELT